VRECEGVQTHNEGEGGMGRARAGKSGKPLYVKYREALIFRRLARDDRPLSFPSLCFFYYLFPLFMHSFRLSPLLLLILLIPLLFHFGCLVCLAERKRPFVSYVIIVIFTHCRLHIFNFVFKNEKT
jgi:hypothetical protein